MSNKKAYIPCALRFYVQKSEKKSVYDKSSLLLFQDETTLVCHSGHFIFGHGCRLPWAVPVWKGMKS